eukprot:3046900-Lingulodinium_polyedra.AAC.1
MLGETPDNGSANRRMRLETERRLPDRALLLRGICLAHVGHNVVTAGSRESERVGDVYHISAS